MNIWETLFLPKDATSFALLLAAAGVAVSGTALAIGRVLRGRSAPFRYGLLFAGVVGLLAAPALICAGNSLVGLFSVVSEETVRIPAEHLFQILGQGAPEALPTTDEPDSSLSGLCAFVLTGIWAVGVAIGLGRVIRAWWKQRRAFACRPWQPGWWNDNVRQALAEKVGLKAFPPVRQSPCVPMPIVIGLWRPCIVMPEPTAQSWEQSQAEAVLLHEAAHVARRDLWAALAQRLAVVLFWWCPLVHRLSRRLHELRETICDDYALESACDCLAYAELLVATAERLVHLKTIPVAVAMLDSAHGGLEERVARLLVKEKLPMTKLTLTGKICGAAAVLLACLGITTATAYSQAPPPQKRIQIKILVDGKELDLNEETVRMLLEKQHKEALHDRGVMQVEKYMHLFSTTDSKGGLNISDPQIEDLVQKAEKLKPGSGPAVRQALRGAAKHRTDEIEALVRHAEKIAPGSGEMIRAFLSAGAEKHPPDIFHTVPAHQNYYSVPVKVSGVPARIAIATANGIVYLDVNVDPDTLKKLEKGPKAEAFRFWSIDGRAVTTPAPETKKSERAGAYVVPVPMQNNEKPAATTMEGIDFLRKLADMEAAGKHTEAAALRDVLKAVQMKAEHSGHGAAARMTPELEAIMKQLERVNADLLELRRRLDQRPGTQPAPKDPAGPALERR
jgi:beta-lactamase regulating signal transducer with metallopeptidase domain